MEMPRTPGVYVDEISLIPPSVAEVATAVPAFIGYTEKAPDGHNDFNNPKPLRIMSMFEYEYYFGKAAPAVINVEIGRGDTDVNTMVVDSIDVEPSPYLMYHNLQMYFKNGGGPCYIVSVGTYTRTKSALTGPFERGITSLEDEDEPTLIVLTDATNLGTDQSAQNTNYYGLVQQALTQCGTLKDRFTIIDTLQQEESPSSTLDSSRSAIDAGVLRDSGPSAYLMYGAAYYPYLKTTLPHYYVENTVYENDNVTELWDGVTVSFDYVLSPPFDSPPLSPPAFDSPPGAGDLWDMELGDPRLKEGHTDLYNAIKAELSNRRITMPPGGAMAGIYARVDRNRGVWKAPANEGVLGVIGPDIKINNETQKTLNVHSSGKSIDAIRSFVGKGTLVWGARTLAGNDNEWRYVSVRRLFNMIEESVQESTEWAVFEGNDAMTWLKVKTQIEVYLEGLWRRGALAGPSPAAAFFVNVGLGVTMDANDILEGRMNVEIGIAAVRPAEFIILKFSHKMQEA